MKVTNYVLVNIVNTLQVYADKHLPQRISYAIMRTLTNASGEYSIYEKQLKKLFESYSDKTIKDEEGNPKLGENGVPIVEESVRVEFNEQISELLNIEVEIDTYYVDPEVFNYDDKGIYDALSAQDIMILQSILCNKDAEDDAE